MDSVSISSGDKLKDTKFGKMHEIICKNRSSDC